MSQRILVVDDHEDTLSMMRDLLDGEGYAVHTAMNGAEAHAAAQTLKPDLILLDVMLPDHDGIEVATWLCEDPGLGSIPIILMTALTASPVLEDRAKSVRCVRRILYKPCRPKSMLEVIEDVLQTVKKP
jgi:CheY-like chemotaxis protein